MADLGLINVAGNSYYCTGRLSVGVYLNGEDRSAVLIDSSIDDDTARKIDRILEARGYTVRSIINTHSHADHCGGNSYFQNKHGAEIYATPFESHFIETPLLEPLSFCCGAEPFNELRNKLLEAKSSRVDHRIPYSDGSLKIGRAIFYIVTLPGHTQETIGIVTPDKVLYVGDALFGEETFDKHRILFYTDIAKTRASLEKMRHLDMEAVVAAHGGLIENLPQALDRHLDRLEETSKFILETIEESAPSLDQLTQSAMKKFGIDNNVVQYVLTNSCVRAYVADLQERTKISLGVQDGLLKVSKN